VFCLLCYIAVLAPRVLRWTISTGACHLFSSLPFLLPIKETNNLEHVHNTKKVLNQFLPSLCCLLCIFCTPMLILSKECINCILQVLVICPEPPHLLHFRFLGPSLPLPSALDLILLFFSFPGALPCTGAWSTKPRSTMSYCCILTMEGTFSAYVALNFTTK
jgi:hypothetical protein